MLDVRAIKQTTDLLELTGRYTSLRKVAMSGGGEYAGACPMCGGKDRFVVQPFQDEPRWLCRKCTDGKWKDAIDFVMNHDGVTFKQAAQSLGGGQQITPAEAVRIAKERAERIEAELEAKIAQAQKVLDELRQARIWEKYHDQMNEAARVKWLNRGIEIFWQDYWQLGWTMANQVYQCETLSIPIWGAGKQVNNIKHRLLADNPEGGKYRQERRGVPASPFICNVDLGGGSLLLCEGEIKAMVTCATLDDYDTQVAGIPGATPSLELLSHFENYEPIYLILDPDAYQYSGKQHSHADRVATMLGSERVRMLKLPMKIDDAILAGALDKDSLRRLIKVAR